MNNLNQFLKLSSIIISVIILAALIGCSSPATPAPTTSANSPTISSPAPNGPAVSLAITAKNIAFDKTSLTVPVNARVTLNFNNQDAGIPHNVAIYTDPTASTAIFVGTVINGPGTVVYQFNAPSQAGTYFFRCDIHPTIMTGTFIAQ